MKEAEVYINGTLLTDAQSSVLRVAISNFIVDMKKPEALGLDEVGQTIRNLYLTRSREIQAMMLSRKGKE